METYHTNAFLYTPMILPSWLDKLYVTFFSCLMNFELISIFLNKFLVAKERMNLLYASRVTEGYGGVDRDGIDEGGGLSLGFGSHTMLFERKHECLVLINLTHILLIYIVYE